MNILSILIFFPLLGAILGALVSEKSAKTYGIIVAFIEFVASLILWLNYKNIAGMQFIEQIVLIKEFNISYFVGIDGISLFMIVLSTFMTLIALIGLSETKRLKNLIISILVLEMTMVGVFAALDAILFYFFWEFSLLPMLYIIGYWGSGNRIYAAVKFFLYTFFGSLVMLFGLLFIAWLYKEASGAWSFSILDWYRLSIPYSYQFWLFLAIGLGFAIKVPMFPFHTWLPYAHGQAPTIGSVILAAILLKMGTYAFIRFSLPILPDASVNMMIPMGVIGTIMIVYAAAVAFAQKDMKQVIAYSSISHMGIIILGTFALNSEGISAAVFFMLSHGIVSGALFMLVGVIYDRKHTKEIKAFSGLAHIMPRYSLIFAIMLMSSIGLPLTMGFVGEFLALVSYLKASFILTLLAGTSVVFGAIYMLYLYKRVFYGELKEENKDLKDLNLREYVAFIPLVVIVIWLGIYPKPVLSPIDTASKSIVNLMYAKSSQKSKLILMRQNSVKGDK